MDDRLLRDARVNLQGANTIIKAVQATGGHYAYDQLRSQVTMTDKELSDFVTGAAATFRRVSVEVSVACFLLRECSMADRTFERFTELVHETIGKLQADAQATVKAGGA